MNRRELIKSGLLITSASIAALASGCNKTQNCENVSKQDKTIEPKEGVYNISTPLPFNFELIDKLVDLNKKNKKTKITTLYNNLPLPCASYLEEQFQGPKGWNYEIKDFSDFGKYVKYAINKGFHFVYVLNSPKPFSENTYMQFKDELFDLFKKIKNIGCKEIKVANVQLLEILSENTDFDLSASTSFEYHNISQYKNLLKTWDKIKAIDVAIDDNKNFTYLKNLKKLFPKVKLEIMVNEFCIRGCPARIVHPSAFFKVWNCEKYRKMIGELNYFCNSTIIYPWDLPYYNAIGVDSFKFMSYYPRANIIDLNFLEKYLLCIEEGIENLSADYFFNEIFEAGIRVSRNKKLSDIIQYLPNIKHFIKNGDKCAEICGIECNYCSECAEKIEKNLA